MFAQQPVVHKFRLMDLCPLQDQSLCRAWQAPRNDFQVLNTYTRSLIGIPGMEMRRRMIVPKHLNNNVIERADGGQFYFTDAAFSELSLSNWFRHSQRKLPGGLLPGQITFSSQCAKPGLASNFRVLCGILLPVPGFAPSVTLGDNAATY